MHRSVDIRRWWWKRIIPKLQKFSDSCHYLLLPSQLISDAARPMKHGYMPSQNDIHQLQCHVLQNKIAGARVPRSDFGFVANVQFIHHVTNAKETYLKPTMGALNIVRWCRIGFDLHSCRYVIHRSHFHLFLKYHTGNVSSALFRYSDIFPVNDFVSDYGTHIVLI